MAEAMMGSMEGGSVFGDASGGEGYVLLGRMEGEIPGYLSYGAEEGEVVCVFRGVGEAERFYERWRGSIPGGGWGAVRLGDEELARVLVENFDLVSVDPRPEPGAAEYLYTVEDFVRALRGPR